MECLKNIVGITQIENECFKECVTDGVFPESTSGLYLDDLEGGISFRALTEIEACRSFIDIVEMSRDTAIKKFEADILSALNLKYKDKRKPYLGIIGRPSYNKTLPSNKDIQYLKISPRNNTESVLTINNIKLILDQSITTTVEIVDENGTVYFSESVTTVANQFTSITLAAPLKLTMDKDYYITWDRTGTNAKPRNVKISCGCSGPSFDDYLIVRGGETDDLLVPGRLDQYTHGFSIGVDIRCQVSNIICKEYDNNNAVSLTSAWAILYKMGEVLNEAVLNSGEVNRYTMMNREYLWGKRNHFRKEYEDRINYLAESINLTASDCFICKDVQFMKVGIMS